MKILTNKKTPYLRELIKTTQAGNKARAQQIIDVLQGKRVEVSSFLEAAMMADIPDEKLTGVEVVATGQWKILTDELNERNGEDYTF